MISDLVQKATFVSFIFYYIVPPNLETRRAVFMTSAPDHGRNMHMRNPPIDGFWTWDVKRDRVYGNANVSDYFGLTLHEFSHGASLERRIQSIDVDDRRRVRLAIRKTTERKSGFRKVYRVRSQKMGLRKILAVCQCYVDSVGEAALYPAWFADLTRDATWEEQSLRCPRLRSWPLSDWGAKYRPFRMMYNRFVGRASVQPGATTPHHVMIFVQA